jgi:hypothetical protein
MKLLKYLLTLISSPFSKNKKGGFVWIPFNSSYKWKASDNGTNEYYLEL